MPATKIVVIGAGSASFGPATVSTILRSSALRGSELALVDLNAESLENMYRAALLMNEAWEAHMQISASMNRCEVLAGAKFVIVSIEVPPREVLWRLDWEIPLRHGLRQPYGENGGPGGLMHACRQIPPFMAIVRDMERYCPDAWLINFSNPLPRITRGVTKYSTIRTVGKCHQLEVGYGIVATLLASRYGFEVPGDLDLHSDPANVPTTRRMAELGRRHIKIKAAGLNHFTWMVDVRDRLTGEDLYPALRAANRGAGLPAKFEPLTRDLFRIFDYCPVPGDTHLCEYVAWTHDPLAEPWKTYNLRVYDWSGSEAFRQSSQELMGQMANGTTSVAGLRNSHSEGAVELIEAMAGNGDFYDEAANVANNGAISNLPDTAVVELPVLVNGLGVQPIQMGPLPAAVAELCRREAGLVEMVVDTAMTGDRNLALQTLLMDPMINDIGRARAILDDYLTTFADHLPQFE
jgi:alpha-galactosidase